MDNLNSQQLRLRLLQEYLDADRNLKELVEGYRQSRAEWCRAIDAARKRVSRLLNDLSAGQCQPELPLNDHAEDQETSDSASR